MAINFEEELAEFSRYLERKLKKVKAELHSNQEAVFDQKAEAFRRDIEIRNKEAVEDFNKRMSDIKKMIGKVPQELLDRRKVFLEDSLRRTFKFNQEVLDNFIASCRRDFF